MKKVFIVLVLILLLPFSIKATNESYNITNYHVKIKVNKDNSLEIKEDITAFFSTQKRGLEKLIPLVNQISIDNGILTNNAEVKDIKVNNKFNTYAETINNKKYQVIMTGDPYQTIIGEQSYEISYTYNMGPDMLENRDEFYYNIVGNEWNTTVENILFELELPDTIKQESLLFIVKGLVNTEGLNYQILDNKIIGTYNHTLNTDQGIIMRLTLPDGYFFNNNTDTNKVKTIFNIINISFSSIFLIISIMLISSYNRGTSKTKGNIYPPKQCNSTEVGFFLKRRLDTTMISTYIISLANKGYLKVINNNNNLIVKKIKNYDGSNPLEKVFMDQIFMRETEIDNTLLKDKILSMIQSLIINFDKLVKNGNFFLGTKKRKHIIQGLFISILIISNILTFIPTNNSMNLLLGIIVKLVMELFMMGIVIKADNSTKVIISMPFMILLAYFDYTFSQMMMLNTTNMLISFYSLIIALIIGHLYTKISLRTPVGNQIANETMNFCKFIKTTKEKKLKEIFTTNPNYFYDVLPYMISLRIKPTMMYKFINIPFSSPTWYEGDSYTNYKEFYLALYQILDSIAKNSFSPLKEINDERDFKKI